MAPSYTGHLGEFYGAYRGEPWNSAIQGCVIAKWLKLEDDLATKRWFDYWGIHPTTLTYYFAHCLAKVHSRYIARCKDHAAAPFVKPWKGRDPLLRSNTATTALWRARQAADSIGSRYPVFIDACYRLTTSRSWTRMPQPNQMYSEEMMEVTTKAWLDECRVSIQWARNPDLRFYRNFNLSEKQRAYAKWLCGQIRSRAHKAHILATAIAKRHLPISLVSQVFGESELESAKAVLRDNGSI